MTIEELKELETITIESITKEYNETKQEYNDKKLSNFYVYRKKELIDFNNIDTFGELLDAVEIAKEIIEQYKDAPGFYTETDKDANDGTFEMIIHYKELISEEMLQKRIKSVIKNEISKRLKPLSEKYDRDIDCKLLQLFKDGVITWEALQKLVYSDCEI